MALHWCQKGLPAQVPIMQTSYGAGEGWLNTAGIEKANLKRSEEALVEGAGW